MLMYLNSGCRYDLCYACQYLSRVLDAPTIVELRVCDRVLQYLAGTQNFELRLDGRSGSLDLFAHSDSDWAGCPRTRKSVSGGVVHLGSRAENTASPIFWRSKQQDVVALSSTEAEFISGTELVREVIYIQRLLTEILEQTKNSRLSSSVKPSGRLRQAHEPPPVAFKKADLSAMKYATTAYPSAHSADAIPFYVDNAAMKSISESRELRRVKHLDLRYHFIRNVVERKQVRLIWCDTTSQLADLYTKALSRDVFSRLLRASN